MLITVNEGGVLYELETVTSNESGVLYELDTVHANEGGMLHEIHSAVSFPDTLTWNYSASGGCPPTISNNGFTIRNTSNNHAYTNVTSDVFKIKGTVTITVTLSLQGSVSNGSSGVTVSNKRSGEAVLVINNHMSSLTTKSAVLTSGTYMISGGGGYGGPSGNYAALYTISVSFSK